MKTKVKTKNLGSWKSITIVIGTLLIVSLALGMFTKLGMLESFRTVFGSVYTLFLSGFIISYIFFPKTKEFDEKDKEHGAIDWIERIALSFALSIAMVSLVVFYLNLIGIRINLLNASLEILGIMILSGLILYIKNKRNR